MFLFFAIETQFGYEMKNANFMANAIQLLGCDSQVTIKKGIKIEFDDNSNNNKNNR